MEQKGEQKFFLNTSVNFYMIDCVLSRAVWREVQDPFIMTKFVIKLYPITSKAPSRQEETDRRKHIVLISQVIVR